jgi:hypothetical protein
MLEDEEVPAPLRRIAASSARHLPPPLLMSLLDYLDDSAWLREQSHDVWPEADPDDSDPRHAVSALYLLRPDGWEEGIRQRIAQVAAGSEVRAAQEAERQIRRLQRIVGELERRLEEARHAASAARREVTDEFEERIARLEDQRRRAESVRDDVLGQVETLRGEVARLTGELEEADQRIDELRLRRSRRESAMRQDLERGFGRGDALAIAQDLDRIMDTLRVDGDVDSPSRVWGELSLPSGVLPDQAAAIDWLMSQPLPVEVLVDGHNVAHDLASPPDATALRKVEEGLVRLRRLANGPLSIRLFWDSGVDQAQLPVRGLDIRYVASADDAIVERAHSTTGPAVVISTDKEVRERSARRGLLSIWGTALSEWLKQA